MSNLTPLFGTVEVAFTFYYLISANNTEVESLSLAFDEVYSIHPCVIKRLPVFCVSYAPLSSINNTDTVTTIVQRGGGQCSKSRY